MPPESGSSAPSKPSLLATLRNDLLPSLVVFLVALPLCMGIALASGMPVAAGLITGIVGGIVVGAIAGSPLQVSGPAAGLTVIVYALVSRHGVEMLSIALVMAGAAQIVAGLLKLGQWFRAVAPAVVQGMLSGIGILIFANQFHVMFDASPRSTGWKNLTAIPHTAAAALAFPSAGESDPEFHIRVLDRMRRLDEAQGRIIKQLARRSSPGAAGSARTELAERNAAAADQKALLGDLESLRDEVRRRGWSPPTLPVSTEFVRLLDDAAASLRTAGAELTDPKSVHVDTANDEAARRLAAATEPLKRHDFAAGIGLAAIGLILAWGKLKRTRLGVIPPQLTAIVAVTAAAAWLVLPVAYVDVPDRMLAEIKTPDFSRIASLDPRALATAVLTLAVVASAETLLCATAVDQMHSGPRTRYDRELFAQGVGNTLCGFLGGLPMTGVIVRSAANVQAGGKSRWSAVLHGVWLLAFVAFGAPLLRMIPTSSLAAVLVLTGVKLMNFSVVKELAKFGRGHVFVYVATVAGVVLLDLLTGVILGIVLAALKLLIRFSYLEVAYEPVVEVSGAEVSGAERRRADLYLRGAATFLRLPILARELEKVPPDVELHVHIDQLDEIDHACFEMLFNWQKQHLAQGGKLVLDWEQLIVAVRSRRRVSGQIALDKPLGGGH